MPYLIGLLAILAAIVFILWRIGVIFQRGQQAIEAANDLQASVRRSRWRQGQLERPIEAIDEPMLAATAVIVLVLKTEREITTEIQGRLAGALAETFGCPASDARDLVSQALFSTREIADERRWIGKLAQPIAESCTPAERRDVVAALESVAGPDGLTDAQRNLVRHFEELVGLR